jgi:hypothetical protein
MDPPSQKRAEMGILTHAIGIFPQSLGNIPLFRFDFDVDGFTLGDFCEHEFEDSVLQDSRRFGRINFGRQPQLAAELVRAELGVLLANGHYSASGIMRVC